MVTAGCISITFTCKTPPFWLCSRTGLEPRGVKGFCSGSLGKQLHHVHGEGPGDATKLPGARGTGARNNTGSPMATGQGDKFGEWCNKAGTRLAFRNKMEISCPASRPCQLPPSPVPGCVPCPACHSTGTGVLLAGVLAPNPLQNPPSLPPPCHGFPLRIFGSSAGSQTLSGPSLTPS